MLPTHCLDQEYSDKNLSPDHYTGILGMYTITYP